MSDNPPPTSFLRRRPLALTLILITLSAGFWVAHFLATFDLNDYRVQLQSGLAEKISLPVQLGAAHLRLQGAGVAVSFDDLHIGSEQTDLEITAPEFWIILEWRSLLLRRLHFSRIGFEQPALRLNSAAGPSGPGASTDRPDGPSHAIDQLLQVEIRELSIHNGRLQLLISREDHPTSELRFENLSGSIQEIGQENPCLVDLTAELLQVGPSAHLALHGSVGLPDQAAQWRAGTIDMHLEGDDLDSGQLVDLFANDLPGTNAVGRFNTHLELSGSPSALLRFRTDISSDTLQITPSQHHAQPITIGLLQTSGNLTFDAETFTMQNLAIHLDDMRAAGQATYQRTGPGEIQITLANSRLPIKTLKQWLPGKLAFSDQVQSKLKTSGTLWVEQAEFIINEQTRQSGRLLTTLQAEVESLHWAISPDRDLEISRLPVSFSGDRWQVRDGQVKTGPLQVTINGTFDRPVNQPDNISLLAKGGVDSSALQRWLPPGIEDLELQGKLPLELSVEGPSEDLLTDLIADLSKIDLRYGDHLHLLPAAQNRFNLHGRLTTQGLTVDHALLQWAPIEGRFNGNVHWNDQKGIDLTGQIVAPDLRLARQLSPHIEKIEIDGAAQLDLTWTNRAPSTKLTASLFLNDVALPMRGVIGDLSQINGRLDLTDQGFRAERITAHIGRSPVSAKAVLKDFKAPVLELDLAAAEIRADELIFYSDRQYLRDLKGQMTISPEAITFDPVEVTLDGGTQASVFGRVDDFKNPKVALDITSEFARIDEVIGLWTDQTDEARGERTKRKEQKGGTKRQARVEIRAHAAHGDLYGLTFHDAEGLIVPRDGMLIIHPLDFKVGEGYCNAQVLVDFSGEGPSLLRISGHAEEVDAHEIHNEMLKRKGILTGKLRGDFYLQGRAGKTFLPTSYGSIRVSIKDGVLRQFKVLSKVFSILNVAQLFSLKLPDMAREGLPFSEISGDLLLEEGIISSEGLVLKSEAMNQSYLGKLSLIDNSIDMTMAIHPLGTVDKIISRIPVAGWLLTGEDKALITAHFTLKGTTDDPEVDAIPVTSISSKASGIILRTLGLPIKVIEKPAVLWGGE
jgi:hypothetical protein